MGQEVRGEIKSCMREKQDERKENDEHQKKRDSWREVSDWLLTSSACLWIELNAFHVRDLHLGIFPFMSMVCFDRDAPSPIHQM